MTNGDYIEQLFQKFVDNSCTAEEYARLMDFLKAPENAPRFEEFMERHWHQIEDSKTFTPLESDHPSNRRFSHIISQLERNEQSSADPVKNDGQIKMYSVRFYRIAATVVLLLGVLFLYQRDKFLEQNESDIPVEINKNAITLKLDDESLKVISGEKEQQIADAHGNIVGTQNGNRLNYTKNTAIKELVYNELTVPYGHLFDLVLSDGTKIKLNAGSWLRYPVQFIQGEKRKVYLKGEAYFDVTEDKSHPFIVNANDIDVEVLGTEFNLSFYPEDDNISTVLVEGSVKLYENGEGVGEKTSVMLAPGHEASWDKAKRKMQIEQVDTELYTAWKDGTLLFKNMPFPIILRKLERHFDVTIENGYTFLENQVYTASFKGESIQDIMEAFKEDTPFTYEMMDNTIRITQPITNHSNQLSQ